MAITPITQTITPVTSVPDRSTMDQETFDFNATLFADQIKLFGGSISPWSAQANNLAVAINELVGILSNGQYGNIDFLRLIASPGDIIYTARQTPPVGTIKANGAAVSVSVYADMASAIYCGDTNNDTALWGYRCTNTDGSGRSPAGGYIVVPDLRGEFMRGWDDGRGVDSGRALGTAQGSQNLSHNHPGSSVSHNLSVGGDCNMAYSATLGYAAGGGYGAYYAAQTGCHGHPLYGGVYLAINSQGGNEARPRNIALLACIKY